MTAVGWLIMNIEIHNELLNYQFLFRIIIKLNPLFTKHFMNDTNIIPYLQGQTCMDLVDPSMSAWLADALNLQRRINNNNHKRRRTPPQHDAKGDIEITPQSDKAVNGRNTYLLTLIFQCIFKEKTKRSMYILRSQINKMMTLRQIIF